MHEQIQTNILSPVSCLGLGNLLLVSLVPVFQLFLGNFKHFLLLSFFLFVWNTLNQNLIHTCKQLKLKQTSIKSQNDLCSKCIAHNRDNFVYFFFLYQYGLEREKIESRQNCLYTHNFVPLKGFQFKLCVLYCYWFFACEIKFFTNAKGILGFLFPFPFPSPNLYTFF